MRARGSLESITDDESWKTWRNRGILSLGLAYLIPFTTVTSTVYYGATHTASEFPTVLQDQCERRDKSDPDDVNKKGCMISYPLITGLALQVGAMGSYLYYLTKPNKGRDAEKEK